MFQYEVEKLNGHSHVVEADWYDIEHDFTRFYANEGELKRTVFAIPNSNVACIKRITPINQVVDADGDNVRTINGDTPPVDGAWIVCDICDENQDQPVYSVIAPPHDEIGRACNVYTICEDCFEDNFDLLLIKQY